MIVQCATFSKSLNPRNIDKCVWDIRIRIRFPFESSFWVSLSGCKLTILPDILPANRIVIISDAHLCRTGAAFPLLGNLSRAEQFLQLYYKIRVARLAFLTTNFTNLALNF